MHTFNVDLNAFVNPIIDWMNNTMPKLPGALIGLLVGILVVRILTRLTRWIFGLTSVHTGLRQIITSGVETLLWIMLTILFLQAVGFGGIIVFFSSSALALGILLAAGGSTLLADLVSGIFLARDYDFNVGDEIIAGENLTQGVIVGMDVRRVRIRDKKGKLHVLPNSVVERKEWVVISRAEEINVIERALKTARKLRSVALETKAVVAEKKAAMTEKKAVIAEKKAAMIEKKPRLRKNAQ